MKWIDKGNLFGTTFQGKRSLKKETNNNGQVRISVHALNDRVKNWEPICSTAPFENDNAFEQWINEKVGVDVAIEDPELALALLLHEMLYGSETNAKRSHPRIHEH